MSRSKAMPRPIRDAKDLLAAATHVCYEIQMLRFSGADLGPAYASPPAYRTGLDSNMALESFLLHFRNLRAFICPPIQSLKEDDIIASDFLDEVVPKDYGTRDLLDVDHVRIDRMLAHLSYSREKFIDEGKCLWYTALMASQILVALGTFLSLLPAERAAWFPSVKELADAEHYCRLVADHAAASWPET